MRNLIISILLAPFALIYGLGVSLRNFFYSKGLLKGIEFNIPVIGVGNLSMGGAGKTPHVEYLVRLLKDYLEIATLSRGYKRKTKGFLIATPKDNVLSIGDEPAQFLQKFPDITVTVAENRMYAIPALIGKRPQINTVILDDAFQHRSVKPSLNILLTPYSRPFTKDFLLPMGRLREWRSAYQRADVIIISKCHKNSISSEEREQWKKEIPLLPQQKIFFSKYKYLDLYPLFEEIPQNPIREEDINVLLVCALANADYLASHLEERYNRINRMEYTDHHLFSEYDISRINNLYQNWDLNNKIIITTEKDAERLKIHKKVILEHQMPIYVLPVEVQFLDEDQVLFDDFVKQFLLNFKV